jgi:hypothetical protein
VPVRRRRNKTKNRHAGSAPVAAAPNDVWAIDFCFDVTTDRRAHQDHQHRGRRSIALAEQCDC